MEKYLQLLHQMINDLYNQLDTLKNYLWLIEEEQRKREQNLTSKTLEDIILNKKE